MGSHAHALIVAAGDVDVVALTALAAGVSRAAQATASGSQAQASGSSEPPRVIASADRPRVIAADGGAARCLAAGVRPDIVVGDFDSLPVAALARLRELGVEVRTASPDKDESDMELCLLVALERAVTRVTILGALGIVRPEHSFANLLLLADPRFDDLDVAIVGYGSRTWRIGTSDGPGEARVKGGPGDHVSLLPLDARVEGVRTDGLRFPLHEESLPLGPSRGLSNELLGDDAHVTTRRGRLLVVHTDRQAESGLPTSHQED
jgi:thiamine pyrophosphokinase